TDAQRRVGDLRRQEVELRRRIRTFLEQQLAAMEGVELDPPGSRGGAIVEPVGERMARELAPERAAERDAQAADRTPEPSPEPAASGPSGGSVSAWSEGTATAVMERAPADEPAFEERPTLAAVPARAEPESEQEPEVETFAPPARAAAKPRTRSAAASSQTV